MRETDRLKPPLDEKAPEIRRDADSILLLNDRYKTPNTSLILFHFEPQPYASSEERLRNCSIEEASVEGKGIYLFDDFFLESESEELRAYTEQASFSRRSYASSESQESGEEPARSMNNREKWEFFAAPSQPIKEVYKLLELFAHKLNADISTLPWDLCDKNICASAVATNRIERVSKESMERGKHVDYDTQKGIPFGIPCLYSSEKTHFPGRFVNGETGNPWLISLMIYAAPDHFSPKYGMGTIFCKESGELASKALCRHGRIVLFEGDILHSIEESQIPAEISSWRVSYVFKIIVNPKESNQNMRALFRDLIKSYH